MSNDNNNKNSATYLPYSEHCLAPKFLATPEGVAAFVRLACESHATTTPSVAKTLFLSMPGLTEAQKNTVIKASEGLEKNQSRNKPGCQF